MNTKTKRKWEWDYKEKIDCRLSEADIKKAINHKLANIIIELECNSNNYMIDKNDSGDFEN